MKIPFAAGKARGGTVTLIERVRQFDEAETAPHLVLPRASALGADVYRDHQRQIRPGDRQFGPGHVYVGNVRPGTEVWTTTGKRLKVSGQSNGSTSVHGHEPIARGTVVTFTEPMVVVCAWCEETPEGVVTHGMCEKCAEKFAPTGDGE